MRIVLVFAAVAEIVTGRSEEHTSELQSLRHLVCRLLLEKKKKTIQHSKRQINTSPDDYENRPYARTPNQVPPVYNLTDRADPMSYDDAAAKHPTDRQVIQ